MRRTALASIVTALLLIPAVAAQGQDSCDLTVEATRTDPGAEWSVSGSDPSVLAVIATGELVTWEVVADGYAVETVMSEGFPAEPQATDDGSLVDIGSTLTVTRGTDEGSVEGAARVSICVDQSTENTSVVAGVQIASSDSLPSTGLQELAPYVGSAALLMTTGAVLSGTALVVGRRIVAG